LSINNAFFNRFSLLGTFYEGNLVVFFFFDFLKALWEFLLIFDFSQITLPNTILAFEKNQRFLLIFGALSPNLFLDLSQHVQFLRLPSINLPKTLKTPLLRGFGMRPQGILRKPKYT
jgi:hypothetical protein